MKFYLGQVLLEMRRLMAFPGNLLPRECFVIAEFDCSKT